MNAERWHRIAVLFDQALELPKTERNGFVEGACGADLSLRRDLHALLADAHGADHALDAAIGAEVKLIGDEMARSQVGRRIGPFRLIEKLGEGGMGAVYLAQRDEQFAHRVAIKILSRAIGSPEAVARFRDERQFLAALEHPNIVRLFDGGSTDNDLPYLVMEYIEGKTIAGYADQHALSIRARVELVRQVCAALQYAHQKLIVHRDIKPSNILVDSAGVPKILDFGIAKLLAPTANIHREAQTRTGFAIFTPEYASPEQAREEPVSTATDVYSVGAVLYELVTGQPAHRATGGRLEILRMICEVDPPRPSTVAPQGRRRELAGDLDNIILKALQKDPARRYASMEQLADDLRRWLEGLPIAARTATIGYRARKFVRRNKGTVAATTLVAATLIAATFISLRQASRADEQAARAERTRGIAVDEARRAQTESERARKAEAEIQRQLDELKAEQERRAAAEAEARAKGALAELRRKQAEVALTQAKMGQRRAEQESAKARSAEELAKEESARAHEAGERARKAAEAESDARKTAELLAEKERARADRAERASGKITKVLP